MRSVRWFKIILDAYVKGKGERNMLIIDENSVYEIDEECVKKRKVPKECEVYKKLMQERNSKKDKKER